MPATTTEIADLMRPIRTIYSGILRPGGTSRHRRDALAAIAGEPTDIEEQLPSWTGHRYPDWAVRKLGYRIDWCGSNRRLVEAAIRQPVDLVWLDKPVTIRRVTLQAVRDAMPSVRIVSFSGDDYLYMPQTSKHLLRALGDYDLVVTTKSYRADQLRREGARDVLFVNNSFEPTVHRPHHSVGSDARIYDTVFIGVFEPSRARSIEYLAAAEIDVHIWGSKDWIPVARRSSRIHLNLAFLRDHEYAEVLSQAKIGLGFLRKVNGDQQTTRSVEIPACGALLVAERTQEHMELFKEGSEALYFGDDAELLRVVKGALNEEGRRVAVAQAGMARANAAPYTNTAMITKVLDRVGLLHDTD